MAASRPNILWIVTTQWRGQALGCMGDVNAETPHLDRLAASSVVFEQAVTPHPFGPFARAAMLTGAPSPANGVVDYFDPLPLGARTIAHDMNDRGYHSAFFGKWHLWKRDRTAPLVGEVHARTVVPAEARGGFAFWEGFESGFLIHDPWLHGTRLPEPVRVPGYQSDVLCERAAAWLEALGDRPWFCLLSLEPPHPPYTGAPGEPGPAPARLRLRPNVPTGSAVEAQARSEMAGYYQHIRETDRAVGQLLSRLDASRTVVVFTSVHGDMHGSQGLFRKGWPYEESVRIPLLFRTPDAFPVRCAAAVTLLDLPALTRAAADREPLAAFFGRDWAPLSMPSVVPVPRQCDRRWRGLRSPARKLVLGPDDEAWLFFDLEDDPYELRNLARDPARRAERDQIRAVLETSASRPS